jgi:hypothetical protein
MNRPAHSKTNVQIYRGSLRLVCGILCWGSWTKPAEEISMMDGCANRLST